MYAGRIDLTWVSLEYSAMSLERVVYVIPHGRNHQGTQGGVRGRIQSVGWCGCSTVSTGSNRVPFLGADAPFCLPICRVPLRPLCVHLSARRPEDLHASFVDDLLFASNSREAIHKAKVDLSEHFKLHDRGPAASTGYIQSILEGFGTVGCNPLQHPWRRTSDSLKGCARTLLRGRSVWLASPIATLWVSSCTFLLRRAPTSPTLSVSSAASSTTQVLYIEGPPSASCRISRAPLVSS